MKRTPDVFYFRITRCAVLVLPLLGGCSSILGAIGDAMTRPEQFNNSSARWPLEFRGHSFGVATYSTYGAKIVYNGSIVRMERDDELKLSSDSVNGYPDNLRAGRSGYYNFPPPAVVTWRSRDGMSHRAEVDIGEIFKDQLVRHRVSREDVAELGNDTSPGIILEVNDRTINVYMKAWIGLKKPIDPGNRLSDYRHEVIQVYSHTY